MTTPRTSPGNPADHGVLSGVLVFHSETGTEGGYWAFQDEQFTGLEPPNLWWCPRCGRIWDKDRYPDTEPKPSFTYWNQQPKSSKNISGYRGYDEPHPELPTSPQPDDFNDRWTKSQNASALACYESGHAPWQSPREQHPQGVWSYEGLHILTNHDHLTIYNADRTTILWAGDIDLTQLPLFTEGAGGMWIHADQRGVDRQTWSQWFFDELPADLLLASPTEQIL